MKKILFEREKEILFGQSWNNRIEKSPKDHRNENPQNYDRLHQTMK